MICNNCGKEIPEISKFCRYCGTKVENVQTSEMQNTPVAEPVKDVSNNQATNSTVTVVFQRKKKMMGCAIPIRVHVDGNTVAVLKNGATQEVTIPAGKHTVIFDTVGELNQKELEFSPEYSKVYIELGMRMGLITGIAEVISIRNEK